MDALVTQLTALGPWGWIAAAAVLLYEAYTRLWNPSTSSSTTSASTPTSSPASNSVASPATPAATTSSSGNADGLLSLFTNVVSAIETERARLGSELTKLPTTPATPAAVATPTAVAKAS